MSERYTVSLSTTHWESLLTQGRLRAWVEARQMGMTVEQCDRIADAAVAGVRELVEEWAQQQGAGPVRPGEDAVVAYRWDTNHGGHRTSNIWCPGCNNEFQQSGTADADLTARDVTPGQTCDVCGKDILTGEEPTT